jgi:ABC-type sugar transport system permease subunit
MIREVILITLTLWVIGALKAFGLIQAMSLQLDEKTNVVSVRQYELAFSNRDNIYQMGYATAMAVVLLVLIVVFALGLRLLRSEDELEF